VISYSSPAWTLRVSRRGDPATRFAVAPATTAGTAQDDSHSIVFAGVLYNGGEIDARFGACQSDAQRVLRVFRSDPRQFIRQLRGIFAFVVLDRRSGEVIAARDPLGVVPLFFTVTPDAFIFSPSLRILNASPDVSREPNAVMLAEHIADLWTRADETYTAGVRRVLPSNVHRFAQDGESCEVYWDPAKGASERDADEVFEKYRTLLDAAVERHMRLGKTGLFLSGGVDSISVAATGRAIAARSGLPVPTALSLFYRDSETNEEEAQRFVARELGLDFVGSSLDDALQRRPALDMLLEASHDWPAPMWNLWLPAFLELARMGRAANCEVIVTGGGGDEWLGVGPYLAADMLRSLRFVAYVRFLQSMHRSYSMPYGPLLRNIAWSFGAKQLIVSARNHVLPALGYDIDASRARRALPDWLAPDPAIRRAIVERLTQAKRAERLLRNEAPSLYEFEARRSLRHPIVINEVENKFFMGEATGTRFLEPYWDAELVDLLYRTPPDILNPRGVAKGLVHRLVREALPSFQIPKQKKMALGVFYRNRIRREADAAWRAIGGVRALSRLGLIDERKFGAMVARMLAQPDSRELWLIPHVLSVEAWARAR
jgi:asparagine synthetase B (glutamine-hydrolysing)